MFKSNRYLIIASTVAIISIVCLMILYRQLAVSSLLNHETRSNVAITKLMLMAVWLRYQDLIEETVLPNATSPGDSPAITRLNYEIKKMMQGSRLLKVKIYNGSVKLNNKIKNPSTI